MADLTPPVQTETLTYSEATATWLSLLTRSVSETLTLSETGTLPRLGTLNAVPTAETLRVTDWKVTSDSGALEAGIYDLTVGGGSPAVGKWQFVRIPASGAAPVRPIRFYTPAGGSFVTVLRVKAEAGDRFLLMGPNAGLVNAVRRWV